MNFIELFFLAIGLSMDTFAAIVCAGLDMTKATGCVPLYRRYA